MDELGSPKRRVQATYRRARCMKCQWLGTPRTTPRELPLLIAISLVQLKLVQMRGGLDQLPGGVTVMVGLVAAMVYPLLSKSRNSYVPAVEGMLTVHVRVVTPAPTYVQFV